MVQTIGRCHVPQLKNAKTLAFLGEQDKELTVSVSRHSSTILKIGLLIALFLPDQNLI